ncbi:uncharacterized protein LOC143214777 isoform X2 [Lasioglossum baleicum]|uniref:uncharacterized protein LOC143214777 isoform X2 n=1 Tax=Lasioglossum baleicum TaxID=434251 RepID=UPI003FCDC7A3
MAVNTNVDSPRSLKKKKMEVSNPFNDELSDSIIESVETPIDIEYLKIENNETPTKKKCETKILQTNYSNCSNKEKTNVSQHSDDDYNVTNGTNSSLISIRKMEDLCKTPIRNNSLNESIHRNSIKNENTPSPVKFSSSMLTMNSSEWNCNSIKELQETPTPIRKKKLYIDESSTPAKRKKRKMNNMGEYVQVSDSVKTEYDDTPNEMEHIEMLHDLESVMDFRDSKISIFLSPTNDTQDEENLDVSKDPQVDPLSIDKHDIHDTFIENGETKYNTRLKNKRRNAKSTANNVKNTEINLNSKESDETPSGIKIALGDLDIMLDNKEKEELSEDAIKRLYNLKVQLMHDVPPQHKIQWRLSKSLTTAEKNMFLQHASLRRGIFLPHEDEIIKRNWKKFCEVHDWDPKIVKPFLFMKNGKKFYIKSPEERQKFLQYLANGLPCRSLNSILYRCRNLLIKNERCAQRYRTEEDELILSYIKNSKKRKREQKDHFSKLGKMLNRNRQSVSVRYRTLRKSLQSSKTKKPTLNVEWTLQLIGEFIHNLMDVMLCGKLVELKDAIILKPIWLKLEEKFNIDWNVLKDFWFSRLHLQLFSPEPIYLNDIRIKLIEYIYGKGISNVREISWPSISRYFDGITSCFLCKVFFWIYQEAEKKACTTYFPDVIEYLYNTKIREIKNTATDKFLPRLSYKNKTIEIVDEDSYIAKKM